MTATGNPRTHSGYNNPLHINLPGFEMPRCSDTSVDVSDSDHTCPELCPRHNPKWKTREGKLIPIAEMDDGHLQNTIRLLRRNLDRYHDHNVAVLLSANPSGEMAQDAVDRELDRALENGPDWMDYPATYWLLLEEAAKRGMLSFLRGEPEPTEWDLEIRTQEEQAAYESMRTLPAPVVAATRQLSAEEHQDLTFQSGMSREERLHYLWAKQAILESGEEDATPFTPEETRWLLEQVQATDETDDGQWGP